MLHHIINVIKEKELEKILDTLNKNITSAKRYENFAIFILHFLYNEENKTLTHLLVSHNIPNDIYKSIGYSLYFESILLNNLPSTAMPFVIIIEKNEYNENIISIDEILKLGVYSCNNSLISIKFAINVSEFQKLIKNEGIESIIIFKNSKGNIELDFKLKEEYLDEYSKSFLKINNKLYTKDFFINKIIKDKNDLKFTKSFSDKEQMKAILNTVKEKQKIFLMGDDKKIKLFKDFIKLTPLSLAFFIEKIEEYEFMDLYEVILRLEYKENIQYIMYKYLSEKGEEDGRIETIFLK